MSEFEEIGSTDSQMPDMPSSLVRQFNRESQVDFEIDFYRSVLERDPHFVEALKVLATNLSAKGLYDESLEVDQRLVRLRPDDKVALYNLACSYSMVSMIDSSLESLKRAIDSGYSEFEYMQQDADLELTRRDPRFRELLANYGVQ
jgi:tetratricopeptide (TPR) repeat protein